MPALTRLVLVGVALSLAACGGEPEESETPLEAAELFAAVDPMIGTGGIGFGVGSAYPGPAVPFAMIHPSPDSRSASSPGADFYHCSGYYYDDAFIGGFSLLHFHGTGANDYGVVSFMPTLGMSDQKTTADGYRAGFSHADERASPGAYRVRLADGIEVEITSSLRAALFRYSFPEGAAPVVLLDLGHGLGGGRTLSGSVTIDPASGELEAAMHSLGAMSSRFGGYEVYARAAFDVAPKAVGVWDDAGRRPGEATVSSLAPEGGATSVGGYLEFPSGTQTVTMRVAVSFVDAAGAAKNLAAEAPGFEFEAMRAAAEAAWRSELGRVEIFGASERETTLTATALYHSLLMPTLMSDVDGRVVAMDGSVTSTARPRYSDFSLWDTYRTLHPWLLLAEDPRNADFAASLVAMGREGGAVPRWSLAHGDAHSMIGSPGEIVLAESALKGVPFDDEGAAYDVARVAAFEESPGPSGGRGHVADYILHGYVPADVSDGSVSETQEYAVADGALKAWAARLGRDADHQVLAARAKSYARLFEPELGFFRGKNADGSFTTWVSPTQMSSDYVEGNAWQYLWMAPHDPDGLAEVLGGEEAALARLRGFFDDSMNESPIVGARLYYWQSNEPDIHAPWLFTAWGSRADTARVNDWIVGELYGVGPDGIPGNDDGGTMSAWLLLADAGLYPVTGSDRYLVGAPRFPRMVIHRASGELRIEARPAPAPGLVPGTITLDGRPLEGATVTHGELEGAHRLVFHMIRG